MALALGATAIVVLALFSELARPRLRVLARRCRDAVELHRSRARRRAEPAYDPGRELRAEQRARALLRSCINEEEWAMYRDLGFLRVWGARRGEARAEYAYLLYPHKPIVAYLPQTGAILGEYCVAFKADVRARSGPRLPDADDVLAKWMLLAADEHGLLEEANMHMPGRQVDPEQIESDLVRLRNWERVECSRGLDGSAAQAARSSMPARLGVAKPELASRAGSR